MMPPSPDRIRHVSAQDWPALKEAIKRFEDAWGQGLRPVIDDYLPVGDPLRCRVLIELTHIDLELRLKAGEAVRVEEYLSRYPEVGSEPAIAVELIVAEHDLRRRGEPDLSVDEYLERFPHYRGELR